MSSAGSSIVADVALQPSLRAVQWAFWLHAIPAALLPFVSPPPWFAVGILLLIFASWMFTRRHAALGFGPRAIRRILARADGSWWIEDASGRGEDVRLLPDSVVTGGLLVLCFGNDAGRRRVRLILGSEGDEEALRRLRVRLQDARPQRLRDPSDSQSP